MRNPIKALNEMLRRELGETPNSLPRFKWQRTDRMWYFEKKPGYVEKQTAGGLWISVPDWRKFNQSDLLGVRWALTMWRPWQEIEWRKEHGEEFPWPSQGEYEVIGGGLMRPDDEPNIDVTNYCISKLKAHMELSLQDHKRQILDEAMKREADKQHSVDDQIDDLKLPFMQVPGTKGAASLPTPAFMRDQSQPQSMEGSIS